MSSPLAGADLLLATRLVSQRGLLASISGCSRPSVGLRLSSFRSRSPRCLHEGQLQFAKSGRCLRKAIWLLPECLAACKDRKTLSGYMCQTGCYYSALVCILADPPIFHKMSLTNLTCSTPVTSGFPFRTALRTLLLMHHTLLVHSHKKPLLSLSLCMLPLSLSTHTRTPSPRHTRKGGVQRRHSSAVPSLSAA